MLAAPEPERGSGSGSATSASTAAHDGVKSAGSLPYLLSVGKMDPLDLLEMGASKDLLNTETTQPPPVAKAWETLYLIADGKDRNTFYLSKTERLTTATVVMSAVLVAQDKYFLSRYAGFPDIVARGLPYANRCCAVLRADDTKAKRWKLFSTQCELCDAHLHKFRCTPRRRTTSSSPRFVFADEIEDVDDDATPAPPPPPPPPPPPSTPVSSASSGAGAGGGAGAAAAVAHSSSANPGQLFVSTATSPPSRPRSTPLPPSSASSSTCSGPTTGSVSLFSPSRRPAALTIEPAAPPTPIKSGFLKMPKLTMSPARASTPSPRRLRKRLSPAASVRSRSRFSFWGLASPRSISSGGSASSARDPWASDDSDSEDSYPTERQCLAKISHSTKTLAGLDGQLRQLSVRLPGNNAATGMRTVWCPRAEREAREEARYWAGTTVRAAPHSHGTAASTSSTDSKEAGPQLLPATDDSSSVSSGSDGTASTGSTAHPAATSGGSTITMRSQLPTYAKEDGLLTLNFSCDRAMTHSANNFLLGSGGQDSAGPVDAAHLQFGRLGKNTHMLMFNHPLSALQAFGIALTTFGWEQE